MTTATKPIRVLKFGGTSVATPELIGRAATRIGECRAQGHGVLAVVSAMGNTTDELVQLALAVASDPPRRELDVLLSAGELQTMALLAMALQERGIDAISLTGAQGGIVTDARHSEARIRRVDSDRIRSLLEQDRVVVVAGFQGTTDADAITTLGRGGSDTSAVALAASLGASCQILTDVDGVFTTDPRVVPEARLIPRLSYDEMLEMASLGSRVLHSRSVELARKYAVPLTVSNAAKEQTGTRIEHRRTESEMEMEAVVVRGISQNSKVQKVSIVGVPDQPGVAAKVFSLLGEKNIHVQLIVQAQSHDSTNDITFVVPEDERMSQKTCEELARAVGGESSIVDKDIGLLSVIGEGITREAGIPGKIFSILAEAGINLDLISTSNLVITCVVPADRLDEGSRALHAALIESG